MASAMRRATPSLPAFAADMAALMDHLGYARFAVGGISGGGPLRRRRGGMPRVAGERAGARQPGGADRRCRAAPTLAVAPSIASASRCLPRSPLVIAGSVRASSAGASSARRDLPAQLATLRGGPERQGADRSASRSPERCSGASVRACGRACAARSSDLATILAALGRRLGRHRAPARLWIGTADTAVPSSRRSALARASAAADVTELPAKATSGWRRNYARVLEWVAATRSAPNAPPAGMSAASAGARATRPRPIRCARQAGLPARPEQAKQALEPVRRRKPAASRMSCGRRWSSAASLGRHASASGFASTLLSCGKCSQRAVAIANPAARAAVFSVSDTHGTKTLKPKPRSRIGSRARHISSAAACCFAFFGTAGSALSLRLSRGSNCLVVKQIIAILS